MRVSRGNVRPFRLLAVEQSKESCMQMEIFRTRFVKMCTETQADCYW